MSPVKPLSPTEVAERKDKSIPSLVIEEVNKLLVKNYIHSSKRATLKKSEVVAALRRHATEKTIYENNWLDFEPIFRAQGWSVTYDQPAYNETYEATYEFKAANATQY